MSSPEKTFLLECGELLTAMEAALLQMEDSPGDSDAINAIFRAAHTIKGTGGVFGYDAVVSFTHVLENVLDKVRDNEITIDSDLIAILLLSRDHIENLVTKAVAEQELDSDEVENDNNLLLRLNHYLDANIEHHHEITESIVTPEVQHEEQEELLVNSDNWHISLRFNHEVLQNGMDPLSFMRYLRKLGTIVHVTTLEDNLPDYKKFNPELCYLGFEIDLSSDATKETIEQVFEFVQDMCRIHILPPRAHIRHYAEMIYALPELDIRIGEILVASGALTTRELDGALNCQSAESTTTSNDSKTPIGEVLLENKVVHKEVLDAALDKQSKATKSSVHNVLRVDAGKLDSLINLVGELVIAGATTNMLARHSGQEALIESMSSMSRLVEEIRDNALNLRMVPIGETFNRFKRVVRDVSNDLGKNIRLIIEGADTELDKTVVEKIGDPLMHLIRNSMDHGIESAEDRETAGKPAQGNLKLNAFHDSGNIVIEVSDDGRGLSKEKILVKAHEKGLIAEGQSLNDNEIYRLIFEAGFSTAENITNLSGRGVGLDVVRRNIEALRGSVEVDSTENKGTIVRIRLPLTLAIIDGFLVRVGNSSYVIPLDMVNECIELNQDDSNGERTQGYINLRDEVLPFIRLRNYFNEPGIASELESIVVVKYGSYKAGFVVDELLGELQTVIKPMGKILQNVKGISGATILGSGEVAVILDVPNLVQRASKDANMNVTANVSNTQIIDTVIH